MEIGEGVQRGCSERVFREGVQRGCPERVFRRVFRRVFWRVFRRSGDSGFRGLFFLKARKSERVASGSLKTHEQPQPGVKIELTSQAWCLKTCVAPGPGVLRG